MIINSKYGSEADVNDEIVQALNNKANVLLESHLEAINTNRTEDLNQETCPTKIEETVEFLVDMTYSVLFTSIVAVMCFRAIDQCVRIGMSGIRALSRF